MKVKVTLQTDTQRGGQGRPLCLDEEAPGNGGCWGPAGRALPSELEMGEGGAGPPGLGGLGSKGL